MASLIGLRPSTSATLSWCEVGVVREKKPAVSCWEPANSFHFNSEVYEGMVSQWNQSTDMIWDDMRCINVLYNYCYRNLYIHIYIHTYILLYKHILWHTCVVMSTDGVTDRDARYKSCATSPEATRSHTRPGPSGAVDAVHRFLIWCMIYTVTDVSYRCIYNNSYPESIC